MRSSQPRSTPPVDACGDAFCAVFVRGTDAVHAAHAAQSALAASPA
jgi:hypothetical protein